MARLPMDTALRRHHPCHPMLGDIYSRHTSAWGAAITESLIMRIRNESLKRMLAYIVSHCDLVIGQGPACRNVATDGKRDRAEALTHMSPFPVFCIYFVWVSYILAFLVLVGFTLFWKRSWIQNISEVDKRSLIPKMFNNTKSLCNHKKNPDFFFQEIKLMFREIKKMSISKNILKNFKKCSWFQNKSCETNSRIQKMFTKSSWNLKRKIWNMFVNLKNNHEFKKKSR